MRAVRSMMNYRVKNAVLHVPSLLMRTKQRAPSPVWVRRGVALVMTIWAAGQLYVVQTRGLNSWRGGGFGMYAGFHPVQNDAWVVKDGEVFTRYWKHSKDNSELFRIIRPHLTFPRNQELSASLQDYAATDGHELEVDIYSPALDLESLELSRKPLLHLATGAGQ